jgi:hypothetical protein
MCYMKRVKCYYEIIFTANLEMSIVLRYKILYIDNQSFLKKKVTSDKKKGISFVIVKKQ